MELKSEQYAQIQILKEPNQDIMNDLNRMKIYNDAYKTKRYLATSKVFEQLFNILIKLKLSEPTRAKVYELILDEKVSLYDY
jgi:hypothetical protein